MQNLVYKWGTFSKSKFEQKLKFVKFCELGNFGLDLSKIRVIGIFLGKNGISIWVSVSSKAFELGPIPQNFTKLRELFRQNDSFKAGLALGAQEKGSFGLLESMKY